MNKDCKKLHFWTKRLLKAELAYIKMYKDLRNECPKKYCLGDWRCTKDYKRKLVKRSEPIRRKINQAKAILTELST